MKILTFYKFCILGGVTTQLANRLKFMKHRSEAHFAFLEDYGGTAAFEGYEHVRILGTIEQISAYIEAHDFDIIITIDTYELYEALRLTDFKGVIVHEVHTTYEQPLQLLAETKDGLPFQHVITPSAYMKNYLATIGIGDAYHINNCLDTELFRYESLPDKEQPKTLLWVGKLDDHKNWKVFLNIAGKLNARRGDLQFRLVGGYTAPEPIKKQLAERVEQLGIRNFQWVPKVDYEDMYAYYSGVSQSGGVYISTTANESFGMTVLEAMSCRCPVVVPEVGALPELLTGRLGIALYAYNDEDGCVERVCAILDDPDLRKEIMEQGESRARQLYSIEKVGKAYMELLESFMERRK